MMNINPNKIINMKSLHSKFKPMAILDTVHDFFYLVLLNDLPALCVDSVLMNLKRYRNLYLYQPANVE